MAVEADVLVGLATDDLAVGMLRVEIDAMKETLRRQGDEVEELLELMRGRNKWQ